MQSKIRAVPPEQTLAQLGHCEKIRQYVPEGAKAGVMTFGCQQNVADSSTIAGLMELMGYEVTDQLDECELIVVNTCAIREHAELKALSRTGQLKHLKTANPRLKIGVCGCMVQQEHRRADLSEKFPYVDFLFGTHMIHRFPEVYLNHLEQGKRQTVIDSGEGVIAEGLPVRYAQSFRAFVNVMLGCDNFCSYCVVPYVRGRQRSRAKADILRQVEELVTSGVREITLLGQNVNSYGLDSGQEDGFAGLIADVAAIPGDFWVRFMTSHPKDVPDSLIAAIAANPKIERHFHLPLQSGDDRVLKAMNRKYTTAYYSELLHKLRQAVPDIAVTTDIIVGFPGETEIEFEHTLQMVAQSGFDNIFSFIFSERKGTPAYDMEGKLPYAVKQERMKRLLELHRGVLERINRTYVGRVERVLVEGKAEKKEQIYTGKTSSGKIINFAWDVDLTGQFFEMEITKAGLHALNGKPVPKS